MFKKYLKLLNYIGPYKRKRIFIIVICSISIAVGSTIPYLIGELINYINSSSSLEEIFRMGIITVAVAILASSLNSYQNYQWHVYMNSFVNYFRALMLGKALEKDISYYKGKSEDFSTKILHDALIIAEDISVGYPMLVLNVLRLGIVVCLMVFMSPKLTLIPLTVIPIYITIFQIINKKLRVRSKEEREKFSQVSYMVNEYLDGIIDIKLNKKENFFLTKFKNTINIYTNILKKIKMYRAVSYGANAIISSVLPVAVLIYGGILVSQGKLELGYLFSFYAYLDFLYEPMNNLVDWYTGLNISLGMCDRVLDFLEKKEIRETGKPIESINKIEIKNLCFSYDGENNVIDGLNLSLEHGDILGGIGSSGSGKSTLIEILLKIWEDYSGSIKINGVELKEIDKSSLYNKVSLLEQEPFIFSDTIRNNITFSEEPIDISSYIENSKARQLIEKKGGLGAYLKACGEELSGGEKQRLAIARVLYKNADLIILDEFTSSLDLDVEKEIVDAIGKLDNSNKIYIIISHRKYPLTITNKIIDLSELR